MTISATSYGLDMTASYAGMAIRNPWGKASGQLSLNRKQIEEAAEARLGLVVLKTVIAQDAKGRQSMSAWAIKESQMIAEPITSPVDRSEGLDDHLEGARLVAVVRRLSGAGPDRLLRSARERNLLVVPSVKYHLPAAGEATWREEEYRETTRALLAAYQSGAGPVVDASGEGLLPDPGGLRSSEPAGHRHRLAATRPGTDPLRHDGHRPSQGRSQAVQQPRRRRLSTGDAGRSAWRNSTGLSRLRQSPLRPRSCLRGTYGEWPTGVPT